MRHARRTLQVGPFLSQLAFSILMPLGLPNVKSVAGQQELSSWLNLILVMDNWVVSGDVGVFS